MTIRATRRTNSLGWVVTVANLSAFTLLSCGGTTELDSGRTQGTEGSGGAALGESTTGPTGEGVASVGARSRVGGAPGTYFRTTGSRAGAAGTPRGKAEAGVSGRPGISGGGGARGVSVACGLYSPITCDGDSPRCCLGFSMASFTFTRVECAARICPVFAEDATLDCDEHRDCSPGQRCVEQDRGTRPIRLSCLDEASKPPGQTRRLCGSATMSVGDCPAGSYCGKATGLQGESLLPGGWRLCQPQSRLLCGSTTCSLTGLLPQCCMNLDAKGSLLGAPLCTPAGAECPPGPTGISAALECDAHASCPAGQYCHVASSPSGATSSCQAPDRVVPGTGTFRVCENLMLPEVPCPAGESCVPAESLGIILPNQWRLCRPG